MYSQNNAPYATSGAYPQSSASVPDVNAYQGQWYNPQAYYGNYDPNYYYASSQAGSLDMSYSVPYMPPTEYQHYDTNYSQNQYAPMTKAYSCDSISQYEKTATPKRSPKLGDLSISPKHQTLSDSRSTSPKSPRFVRVLPTTSSNGPSPASSPGRSDISGSPYSSSTSSCPPSPRPASPPDSPVRQKSTRKELPTFSLSNAESQSDGSRKNYSQKPMYVRVLPPPNLPNKLSPKKIREYTDLSPENSPSRIPVPISETSQKSFKNRLFGKKQESSGTNTSSTVSNDTDKKSKSKYKIKIPVSPKFSPFRNKRKSPKHNQSDEENGQEQEEEDENDQTDSSQVYVANEPEKGPYYRILRSPLKANAHSKSFPVRSYSMPHPTGDMVEHRAKLRPVPAVESKKTEKTSSPEKSKPILRRGRRVGMSHCVES